MSKYIGETEKNLRRLFDAAEASGAVLLFDEADALFGKRGEVKDGHDRYANLEVAYLLQRMESYRGLAILTTNLRSNVDRAFLRRLRFVVQFPFPDAEQRAEIWRRTFPPTRRSTGSTPEQLARLNVSGGSIRSIALSAAFAAAEDGTPSRAAHVLRAAQRRVREGRARAHRLRDGRACDDAPGDRHRRARRARAAAGRRRASPRRRSRRGWRHSPESARARCTARAESFRRLPHRRRARRLAGRRRRRRRGRGLGRARVEGQR